LAISSKGVSKVSLKIGKSRNKEIGAFIREKTCIYIEKNEFFIGNYDIYINKLLLSILAIGFLRKKASKLSSKARLFIKTFRKY